MTTTYSVPDSSSGIFSGSNLDLSPVVWLNQPPAGKLGGSDTVSSVTVAGVELTSRQKMQAMLDQLFSVYLEIYRLTRNSARQHDAFLTQEVLRVTEMEADKMLSSAIMSLVGNVVQGALGLAGAGMQVAGAVQSIKSLKDPLQRALPLKKKELEASAKLKTAQDKAELVKLKEAQSELNEAQSELAQAKAKLKPGQVERENIGVGEGNAVVVEVDGANEGVKLAQLKVLAAQDKLDSAQGAAAPFESEVIHAQAEYDKIQTELAGIRDEVRHCSVIKTADARAQMFHGLGTGAKALGEVGEGAFKFVAAQKDKERMLLEAIVKRMQGTQQSDRDFERDMAELIRQVMDQYKTAADHLQQINTTISQAV